LCLRRYSLKTPPDRFFSSKGQRPAHTLVMQESSWPWLFSSRLRWKAVGRGASNCVTARDPVAAPLTAKDQMLQLSAAI